MLGVKRQPNATFDAELEMKDAGLVAASAAAQVDSAAKILDLGTGHTMGRVMLEVSALEIASNDEAYTIVVQGSPDTDFTAATSVELAALHLGASETKLTDTDKDDAAGLFKLYFDNENNGTYYRYVRLYTVVAGTIATGINYSAFMAKL